MTDSTEWTTAENATPEESEWREVEAEVQLKLEVEGDGWAGRYMGMDPRNDSGIIQAHFTSVTFLNGDPIADSAFTNASRDLERKLAMIPVKSMTRIQWVSSMDTGQVTPMRVFRVQWK